jgi:hypothetical protein
LNFIPVITDWKPPIHHEKVVVSKRAEASHAIHVTMGARRDANTPSNVSIVRSSNNPSLALWRNVWGFGQQRVIQADKAAPHSLLNIFLWKSLAQSLAKSQLTRNHLEQSYPAVLKHVRSDKKYTLKRGRDQRIREHVDKIC